MAMRLDAETLLASVGQDLSELGRECLARGRIRDLDVEDGGAGAVIDDPDGGLFEVWVGVVNGVLTGECDCVDEVPDDVCEHAVAVALKALESEFTFSSISACVQDVDPEEQRFADIAAELAPGASIGLVARHAVADRHFAALLLARAGRLAAPGQVEIGTARRVIVAAAEVLNTRQWQLNDLVEAGETMVTELRLLAVRPPTDESLVVVEEAIAVWATLSGYLSDAWEIYETEPQEIGAALVEVHLGLCQVHDPEPFELAARLARLVGNADVELFLDVPDEYADVLGAEGVAEFEALLGTASR
ncbi:hypothetical protein [Amycolatopsis minnesotensis]|uniref:hypothetical protein n=1 Tax=Amycolatopsis minnesotensis TaxID=337894 RepID=UPI0031D6FBCF